MRNPVEVTVPAGVRFGPVAGLLVRQAPLLATDIAVARGKRCTAKLRTALDIARHEPVLDAVSALDVLLARAIVRKGELSEFAGRCEGRGSRRIRRAAELADPRAGSQPESRLRVVLALAGLHAVPQFTVRDADGDFVARVDLAFPELKIAIKYDGAWHAEPGQFAKDRRRLNRLVVTGWTVIHVTAADMRDPDALVARIRGLLMAARSGK